MCSLEAQPKFNCKIVVTLLGCWFKFFVVSHWALFFVEAIIINVSQLHNQSSLLFCQEMHDKHLNIPAINIRGNLTFSLELCVFYITRNIEVFIWYKNYIIKLGLFEATRVSEQKSVKCLLYVSIILKVQKMLCFQEFGSFVVSSFAAKHSSNEWSKEWKWQLSLAKCISELMCVVCDLETMS